LNFRNQDFAIVDNSPFEPVTVRNMIWFIVSKYCIFFNLKFRTL